MKKPVLILTVGLPGSGKTTFSRQFAAKHGFVHLNSDRIRLGIFDNPVYDELEHSIVYHALDEILADLLKEGKSVIYDANLNRRIHRDEKYAIAKKTDADVITVYFKVPEELALRRLGEREHEIPKHKWRMSPEAVYHHIKRGLEEPGSDEPVVNFDSGVTFEEQDETISQRLASQSDS